MYSMVDYFSDMGQIGQDCSLREYNMDEMELDQVTQVIGYHPRFLDHFLRTQQFIMNGDGPLPYDYRYYLAIIAAARHQCPYLVKMYEKEFLAQGGKQEWLNGLDFIPSKLRAIYDINKILAHRPWLLRTEHIECLTKGKNSWSLSEVVHAMVLLSHFHSLSSFVFSCGLTQKLDGLSSPKLKSAPASAKTVLGDITLTNNNNNVMMDIVSPQLATPAAAAASAALPLSYNNNVTSDLQQQQPPGVISGGGINGSAANGHLNIKPQQQQLPGVTVEALMKRMKVLSENQDECSEDELSSRFKNVELQTAELPAAAAEAAIEVPHNISHYIDDATFTYQDFARRGTENNPTFRIQDYSWGDHGYSLVDNLYNDVGTLLDEKFHAAYSLTYFTMGGIKNVDTSKFRRAIWNYIQCIYGIRHDDYDYGEVNQLLDRPLKLFIKTVCCFPERITKKDYDSILVELQDSEKVHVNLMIMEARNQAELLYALREIMRYRT